MIHYKKDSEQIVSLFLDMKGRSVNIINHEIAKAFEPVLEHLEADAKAQKLAGVILTSAKKSFLAGGDLDYLHNADNAQQVYDYSMLLNTVFRRLEKLGVPIVAAINGAALGSGYELALACHYRIGLDTPHTLIGLPEVNMGMMPGGGGIIRLTWLLGIEKAFEVVSRGKTYHIQEAFQKGLVDAVAKDSRELFEMARQFIRARPQLLKLWDTLPEPPTIGNPKYPATAQLIAELNAQLIKKTYDNYPAPQIILNTIYEGMQVDFEQGLKIVSRQFAGLILSRTCRNMTKAFWYDLNKIKNGSSRPKGFGRFRARKIGIIGAGAMGSGIAYIAALEGIEVILKDISVSIAQQGKEFVQRTLDNLVGKGKMSPKQVEKTLALIRPTEKLADFEDCDLVLEAVFENKELKTRIARETEMYLHRDAFLASNSATLSISELALGISRPQTYIGMHFFVPVIQSNLVELVVGQQTNPETLARAFDFVRNLNKIPIVVRDKTGFYTMRVCRMYILEALALLREGQTPAHIRHAALQSGMVEGPFAMADQISFKFILNMEAQAQQVLGDAYQRHPGISVLEQIIADFEQQGKTLGVGFYETGQADGEKSFWTGLQTLFPPADKHALTSEISDRLIFIQVLEAARCLEEGIISHSADANIGSIYGWGFPACKGGVLQFINDYGVPEFVARAKMLAQAYGQRFAPPKILEEMASAGTNFI